MQTTKSIFSIIIIWAILTNGLSLFNPGNGGLPNRVTLKNAILSIQVLERSTQAEDGFETSVKQAISSLYVAAGLVRVIKQDVNTDSVLPLLTLDSPGLIPSSYTAMQSTESEIIMNPKVTYQLHTDEVPCPPPRLAALI